MHATRVPQTLWLHACLALPSPRPGPFTILTHNTPPPNTPWMSVCSGQGVRGHRVQRAKGAHAWSCRRFCQRMEHSIKHIFPLPRTPCSPAARVVAINVLIPMPVSGWKPPCVVSYHAVLWPVHQAAIARHSLPSIPRIPALCVAAFRVCQ